MSIDRWTGANWLTVGIVALPGSIGSFATFASCEFTKGEFQQSVTLQLASFTRTAHPDVLVSCRGVGTAIGYAHGDWGLIPFGNQNVVFTDGLRAVGRYVRSIVSYNSYNLYTLISQEYSWYIYRHGRLHLTFPSSLYDEWAFVGNWALGVSPAGTAFTFGLFNRQHGAWVQVDSGSQQEFFNVTQNDTISATVLQQMIPLLPESMRPILAAEALNPAHSEMAAESNYYSSDGICLFVTFTSASNGYPYESNVVIYSWNGTLWDEEAALNVDVPDGSGVDGPGSVEFGFLTESPYPDVLLESSGADTPYLGVISHLGGSWHAVEFNFGDGLTEQFVGVPRGNYALAQLDACGCAGGPTTSAWYQFNGSTFQPVTPPGTQQPCTAAAFAQSASSIGAGDVAFDREQCADGWGVGTGTDPRTGEPIVGLFEQAGCQWFPIVFNDGGSGVASQSSGYLTLSGEDIYAIPVSVLQGLSGSAQTLHTILYTEPVVADQVYPTSPECTS